MTTLHMLMSIAAAAVQETVAATDVLAHSDASSGCWIRNRWIFYDEKGARLGVVESELLSATR